MRPESVNPRAAAAGCLALLASLVFISTAPRAQNPQWVSVDLPGFAGGNAAVYDSARDRVVQVADAIWDWNRDRWIRRPAATTPSEVGPLAYDSDRKRVVMFGGGFPTPSTDTWEWDGAEWHLRNPATTPPGSTAHGIVYDPVRRVTVLFTTSGETWLWDGTDWTNAQPATNPPAREACGMVWDAARSVVVMFGGGTPGFQQGFDDTWEWNGTDWVMGPPGPDTRRNFAMVYDTTRSQVVLYGGNTITAPFTFQPRNDTWMYDGVTWQEIQNIPTTPPMTSAPQAAYDPVTDEFLLYGGQPADFGFVFETWAFTPSQTRGGQRTWQLRAPAAVPTTSRGTGLAFDTSRDRVVAFGGQSGFTDADATWEFDGAQWTRVPPGAAPSARSSTAMDYDSARGVVVMFGGSQLYGPVGETWTYDGTWTQHVVPEPSARGFCASGFDSARNEFVVFGGADLTGPLADTWIWDGTAWTQRTPTNAPTPRLDSALAFDPTRMRTVLFGGFDGMTPFDDTWEWDGSDWVQVTPATTTPPARAGHDMAFDPARSTILMVGGSDPFTGESIGDAWEWDGTDWTQVAFDGPTATPTPKIVTDTIRNEVVMSSGLSLFGLGMPTWRYTTRPAAAGIAFGNGCGTSGSPAAPRLAALGRPTVGFGAFAIDVLDAPPSSFVVVGVAARSTSVSVGPCSLLVDGPMLTQFAVTNAAGFASSGLPIPAADGLVGRSFFTQGFVLEPTGGGGFEIALSNGLEIVVGV